MDFLRSQGITFNGNYADNIQRMKDVYDFAGVVYFANDGTDNFYGKFINEMLCAPINQATARKMVADAIKYNPEILRRYGQ